MRASSEEVIANISAPSSLKSADDEGSEETEDQAEEAVETTEEEASEE